MDESQVPFTLVCADCDAGMDITSREQALAAGWSDITFAPDLPMANYVGLCPSCRTAQERADQAAREEREE
jgi:hypothetical protein